MYNPLDDLRALLDPKMWAYASAELAKASPVLTPVYWTVLEWINAHHHTARANVEVFRQLLALDLTLMAFCGYQLMKSYLPGKAS